MMKKLLFALLILTGVSGAFAQIETDGDYRTVSNGNWKTPATWEVRNGGAWSPASVEPTINNNVYLQSGHSVIIDGSDVYCKDLHFGYKGSTYGSVQLGVNRLNVGGKVRVYVITKTPVTGATDDVFYTDQTSSTVTNASMFVNSSTAGVLRFVGGNRIITNTGEWNSNGTVCYGEFALNADAEVRLEVGMKFRGLTISSGKVINLDRFAIGSTSGSGDFTLKNGAIVQFEKNGIASLMASNFSNPINPSGKLEIEEGGTLILKSTAPAFNFSAYINHGTIVYNGQSQTLLTSAASTNPAVSLNAYHKLEIAATDGVEVLANSMVTIADQLKLTSGKLIIPSTSEVALSAGNIAIVGGSTTSYIATLTNGADAGILKINGLSTTKTIPLGSASNYLPVTLNPITSSDFELNVFEGITEDATSNGTALSNTLKSNLVNAIWNVKRTSGSGNCIATLGWQDNLEGANFASLTNAEIGVSVFKDGSYSEYMGTGNSSQNTATVTLTDFGPLSVGKIGVLPVQLVSFDLKKQGNKVNIIWSTASEQNNSYFEIERSADAKEFKVLGRKYAVGDSNVLTQYTYLDEQPLQGTAYYRLVQYDTDGKSRVYDPKVITINNLENYFTVIASDNSYAIDFWKNAYSSEKAKVTVYAVDGKVLASKIIDVVQGNNKYRIETPQLTKGVYIISYQSEKDVYRQKIIK
ncbi:T9SS type A sorting domain-containing protein [Pseudopedobacter beijingensis]|uniref:T9SS type A sorting domain-containing protein n=1 Tax=Pseudopedobacter beijingensis TaxID=1207056 RepID=A0ABW4II63_9SPHI